MFSVLCMELFESLGILKLNEVNENGFCLMIEDFLVLGFVSNGFLGLL